MKPWLREMRWLPAVAVLGGVAVVGARLANGIDPDGIWGDWDAWMLFSTALVCLWYAAGVRRRKRHGHPESFWKQLAYYAGALTVLFAVQSPLDPMADHSFFAHEGQHMVLRMVSPMLLALAAPMPALISGLPEMLRRCVLRPVVRNRIVRGIYAVVIHPAGASLLFLGVLYFWHIPRYFDLTVLHDSWDDFAHVTMLVTGVWFWWMILDPRRRPGRVSFGLRLLVLGITVVPNSLLGAYLTFIHADLYTAYDQVGRWWGLSALTDQQLAGLILWIPGAMMYFIALLVVLWLWRRDELGVGATEAVKAPPAAAFSEFTASS